MSRPTLSYHDPASLVPNPFNPNVLSPDNERKLDESLRRNEMFKPVLVRELSTGELEILGGQHRVESAVRLGYKEIPIFNLGRVDDKRAKEICLIDNSRYGADDTIELAKLLESLDADADELASFLPYSDADLSAIFATGEIDLDDLLTTEDEENASRIDASEIQTVKTHQIMRMKVPVEDAARVTKIFDKVMKMQGFVESDSLSNAGDALVHIVGVFEKAQGVS